MLRETDCGRDATRSASDRWSLVSAAALPALGSALGCSLALDSHAGVILTLVTLVTAFVVFMYCLCSAVLNAVRLRWRRVLSASCGLALGGLTIWNVPTIAWSINRWEDDRQFASQRLAFDAVVERERRQASGHVPLRIVVKIEDRTLIATSNSFYHIIYDEADEVVRDPGSVRGYWRYPASETGVINVGSPTEIEHIDGHYYRFWTTS